MGYFMREHDIFIGSLLEQLNLRFAPEPAAPETGDNLAGGIREMAELQKEFQIFKRGRPFATSVRALNLLAHNRSVSNRWLTLLGALAKHSSSRTGEDGSQAIVNALIENLSQADPLPVYFTSHDMAGKTVGESQVQISRDRPVHYLEQDYLVISLPMQSRQAADRMNSRR
jgi:hypothetical protein